MGLILLFLAALLLIVAIGVAAIACSLRHPPRRSYAAALAHQMPTDPGELGLDFTDTTVVYPDGSRAPAWIVTGAQPHAPTLILTHGFADSRFGPLHLAPLLSPFVSRLILYDLRGMGDSTAPVSTSGLREPDDLRTLMDQLQRDPGERFVLMGLSMGGGISIVAAAADAAAGNERIAGVIADGPYGRWHEPIANHLRVLHYPAWLLVPPLWLLAGLTTPGFRALRDFDRARHAARLPREVPLLILAGVADRICPFAGAQRLAAAAPRAQLLAFAEADHLELAAADPDRYLDALRSFFAEIDDIQVSRQGRQERQAEQDMKPQMNTDTHGSEQDH
jgi:pimeloyl-ACP methyl ester carboxylesterase